MSHELRIYRFSPDQPGKGGQTTGLNAFIGIEDTRRAEGVRPYGLMWERDLSATQLSYQYTTSSKVTTFLEWWYNVGISGATSKRLIGLTYLSGGLWKQTYTVLNGLAQDELYSTIGSATQPPMTLLPVKERLFLATGNTAVDGQSYPTMIWDGVTVGSVMTNPSLTTLGAPSPTVAPTISVGYNWTNIGTYYTGGDSLYVCQGDPLPGTNWTDIAPGESLRLYTGASTYEDVVVASVSTGITNGGAPNNGAHPLGVDVPQVFANTSGTNDLVSFNAVFPSDENGICPQFLGMRFFAAGNAHHIVQAYLDDPLVPTLTIFQLSANITDVLTNTPAWGLQGTRIVLTEPTAAVNLLYGSATHHLDRSIGSSGYTSWSGVDAPGYAYAYYDPVTGHISNLSPVSYVPAADVINGRISIDTRRNSTIACANGDAGISGSSSTTGIQYVGEYYSREVARFTQILWFRTRRTGGGAMLYPLGSLDPTAGPSYFGISGNPSTISGGGTWVDSSSDSQLLLSGRIRPPLTTNHQPRIVNGKGVASRIIPWGMAWWDGRVWVYGPPDIGALHYSCDDAQNTMGRPEECFPDGNRLTIPAGDVEITSILTVGQYLVVNTRKYTWVVMGNHETNYRLVRIATELGGLKATSCCEIPMSGEGQGVMACVTGDQRVLLVDMGGGIEDIGRPIRDVLAGPCRGIQFYRANGHPRLLICVGEKDNWSSIPGDMEGMVYEYNFDHKIWTKNPPDLSGGISGPETFVEAIGSVYRSSPWSWPSLGQAESFPVYAYDGAIWGGLAVPAPSNSVWNIGTWDLPKDAPKRRYSLAWVRTLLVTAADVGIDTLHGPYVTVTADDAYETGEQWVGAMHEHADTARRSYPTNAGLGGDCKEFIIYGAEMARDFETGTRPLGFKLRANVQASPTYDALRYSIPYIEVALREESEDGAVDP